MKSPARMAVILEELRAGRPVRVGDELRMRLQQRFYVNRAQRLSGRFRRFTVTPALLTAARDAHRWQGTVHWLAEESLQRLENHLRLVWCVSRPHV